MCIIFFQPFKTKTMNNYKSTKNFFYLNENLFYDGFLDYGTKDVNKIIFKNDQLYSNFVHYIKSGYKIDPEVLQSIFVKNLESFKKDLQQYFN